MSRVTMRISVLGLRLALRLPDDVALVAAGTEQHFSHLPGQAAADVLALTVDLPAAPANAAEASAVYTDNGKPGTIELERVHLLPGGRHRNHAGRREATMTAGQHRREPIGWNVYRSSIADQPVFDHFEPNEPELARVAATLADDAERYAASAAPEASP
jgi:hypothetical protein